MGGICSANTDRNPNDAPLHSNHLKNVHIAQPDIKVHTVISGELDFDHKSAMRVPLGECNDEQLLAEVARRRLSIHDKITDGLVKETYEFGKVLGHGASGQVTLVTHNVTKHQYACKVVKKDSTMNDAQSMSTEIEIMKRIRHRNIVSMYELYETPSCLWIILELVEGGDLLEYLSKQSSYTEKDSCRHMKQIFAGVHYLHNLGVVHRDLKLDNILMSSSGDIKIADFGLSALVRLGENGYDPEESTKRKAFKGLKEIWGTKEYFAPEVIDANYGPQADVWACACILYEILCGYCAFPIKREDTEEKFFARIKRADIDLNKPAFSHLSSHVKDLLHGMFQVDPVKRLSATQALDHPWCKGSAGDSELIEAHNLLKAKYDDRHRKRDKKK